MENITKQTEYPCSGCSACTVICPRDAIHLSMDAAGFLTAQVDEALCVDCGLCLKVCHRFRDEVSGVDLRNVRLYAVQSSDPNTVQKCSSGGLAHELAAKTIREGGRAVGAVYDAVKECVYHEIISTFEDVSKLDGSKYLQSDPQSAFSEVIVQAKSDSAVRYTVFGTPCQIAGMADVCEQLKIRQQFLLVEIFCHGVPTYKLWETQLERMKNKLSTDSLDSVLFRYKKDDWHSYCLRAEVDGNVFYGTRERELFWQVFFENVLLGDACMTCRLRKEFSRADLRIGDYWGGRFQSRSDGVSAAFACTNKGLEVIDSLIDEGKLSIFEPGTPQEMLRAQNLEGYQNQALHDIGTHMLKTGVALLRVVRYYRAKEPPKRKLKRTLLQISSIFPDGMRAKLRKAWSKCRLDVDI